MAIPIIRDWKKYYNNPDEGLGSTYERVIINDLLLKVCKNFRINSVLEIPAFGFTGMSGINSMLLAKNGYDVSIYDHDKERISLITNIWDELKIPFKIKFSNNYNKIQEPNKSYDMSWNFSSLWFVKNLELFLQELNRITKKVILIMVPNQLGIGYLSQKYNSKEITKEIREEYIDTKTIKNYLFNLDWKLFDYNFIDCPPWPDIGMSKEDFLKKIKLDFLLPVNKKKGNPLTILDLYSESNTKLDEKVRKFNILEKYAPWVFKRFWAHHQYMIFIRR